MLSPRESEIVRLIIAGYENREIADQLSIAQTTVRNYLYLIGRKCGFRNRTQMAVWYTLHPEQLRDRPVKKKPKPMRGATDGEG